VLSIIVLARDRGAKPGQIGLMLAGFGLGGLAGAALAPWLQSRISARRVIIGSSWLCAILIPFMTLAPNRFVIGALAAGMALLGPSVNVALGAARLRITPGILHGRVTSASRVISAGAIPFGSLAAGFFLDHIGSGHTVVLIGALAIVLAIVTSFSSGIRQSSELREAV
jgi:predicted MFS family arabinose efflux permease